MIYRLPLTTYTWALRPETWNDEPDEMLLDWAQLTGALTVDAYWSGVAQLDRACRLCTRTDAVLGLAYSPFHYAADGITNGDVKAGPAKLSNLRIKSVLERMQAKLAAAKHTAAQYGTRIGHVLIDFELWRFSIDVDSEQRTALLRLCRRITRRARAVLGDDHPVVFYAPKGVADVDRSLRSDKPLGLIQSVELYHHQPEWERQEFAFSASRGKVAVYVSIGSGYRLRSPTDLEHPYEWTYESPHDVRISEHWGRRIYRSWWTPRIEAVCLYHAPFFRDAAAKGRTPIEHYNRHLTAFLEGAGVPASTITGIL